MVKIPLLADFLGAGRSSLENLVNGINQNALETAVAILSTAPTIHVIGLSRAFPAATYLAYALQKMDVPAVLIS